MAAQRDVELLRILTNVADLGVGHVRKREFMVLMGRQRVTLSFWRELQELWVEVDKENPLLIHEAEGAWSFICGKGLETDGEWFEDVKSLAEL